MHHSLSLQEEKCVEELAEDVEDVEEVVDVVVCPELYKQKRIWLRIYNLSLIHI